MKKNNAETSVRKFLKSQGFTLSNQRDERSGGVDIVAIKDGEVLLVEVKQALFHNRAWQVDSVSKKQRIVCNTIAIVTPSGILIEPMNQHLKLCTKNGMRYITESVHLMALIK
jgi:Holliday junction resolvase-like predicted endonuclease